MNKDLLNEDVQNYLTDNINANIPKFALQKSPFSTVSSFELTTQLQGKKIASKKIPFLLSHNQIIFPPHLNLEQSSSQIVAEFKSSLFSGKTGIDLSCGSGIDAYFISRNFTDYFAVEPNLELLEIVKHNFAVLKNQTQFINSTSEEFLEINNQKFDLIYLDPDRRSKNNKKNVLLEDLQPNILEIKDKLLNFGKNIVIKLSPLIDIYQLILQIPNIHTLYLIAHKNELKEVLLILDKNLHKNPTIHCVNLETNQKIVSFSYLDEKELGIKLSNPKKYIYIPNVAIMKSNGFKSLSFQLNLEKLDLNSHIYTSNKLINFPGNSYEIVGNLVLKNIKKTQANIISKNYPLDAKQIKNKYKIKDGGENFYLFTQSCGKIIALKLKKIIPQ
ncbi:MAG: RsmD family RNA methyltransferase [Flavobacteriales bacterium]|nr:RsmD family RNA methyltransferase [Flavobacteriales bacterium]